MKRISAHISLEVIRVNEVFWGVGSTGPILRFLMDEYDPAIMPPLTLATIIGRDGHWLMGWESQDPPLLEAVFGKEYAAERLAENEARMNSDEEPKFFEDRAAREAILPFNEDADRLYQNMHDTPYGGEGLGIGQEYTVEEYGDYRGPNAEVVSWNEAWSGFGGGDSEGPTGPNGLPMGTFVLRNEEGDIVALWDEGRWWTPRESAAFRATMANATVRMMAQATEAFKGLNRKQRRRKLKGD